MLFANFEYGMHVALVDKINSQISLSFDTSFGRMRQNETEWTLDILASDGGYANPFLPARVLVLGDELDVTPPPLRYRRVVLRQARKNNYNRIGSYHPQ